MKIGFAHLPGDEVKESINLIQVGEDEGFDAAWLPDQEFYQDPYAMLSLAAQATESIDLGLAVTNPFTRDPSITARAAGTVGNISNGRFTLGIGSGNLGAVIRPLGYDASGIPRRCRETIEIVRGLLSGEDVSYDGTYHNVEDVYLDFPIESKVPIYVGARGPTMLRMAGEYADGVLVHAVSEESFAYVRKYLKKGAQRAGRSLDDIDLVSWGPCIIEDAYRGEFDAMYTLFTNQIGSAPRPMLEHLGMSETKIETIKTYYDAGEVERLRSFLDPPDFDHFIVRGDADDCIDRVGTIRDSNIDQFSVLYFGDDLAEISYNVNVFAAQVLPSVR